MYEQMSLEGLKSEREQMASTLKSVEDEIYLRSTGRFPRRARIRAILEIIAKNGGRASANQISASIGVSYYRIATIVFRMTESGCLIRIKRGHYCLPEFVSREIYKLPVCAIGEHAEI